MRHRIFENALAVLLTLGLAGLAPAAVQAEDPPLRVREKKEQKEQKDRDRHRHEDGTRFHGMDRNRDLVITRAEWRGSENSFLQHDWNRDGVLSGPEVEPGADRDDWDRRDPDDLDERRRMFDRLDTNDDGVVTGAEWRGDWDGFVRLDENDDFLLSRDEFLLQEREGERGLEERFERLDEDRDGRLSRGEVRWNRDVFDLLDGNDDGSVSRDEFFERAGREQDRHGQFHALDEDRDGRLSASEWRGGPELFGWFDVDRDGYVSLDEFLRR